MQPTFIHQHHSHSIRCKETYIKRGPKEGQPHRQLPRLIEIRRKENRPGDEASLAGADQRARHVECSAGGHPRLRPGDQTPGHHHAGQDALETEAFSEELDGEFGGEEADELDCSALYRLVSWCYSGSRAN